MEALFPVVDHRTNYDSMLQYPRPVAKQAPSSDITPCIESILLAAGQALILYPV